LPSLRRRGESGVPVWEFALPSRTPAPFFGEAVVTPRKGTEFCKSVGREPLVVTQPRAAGIDVHAAEPSVAVPPGDAPAPPRYQPADLPAQGRHFGTGTADLEMLADWLQACGVTTVALVPLAEMLAALAAETGRAIASPNGAETTKGRGPFRRAAVS